MKKLSIAIIGIIVLTWASGSVTATPAPQASPLTTPEASPESYPGPDWDQMTPGVDYETSRIGVQLPLDLSYQLIQNYFDNGQVLTSTGIASLDEIGQRYGLINIEPASTYHARKVYNALKTGQADPYPAGSTGFHIKFSDLIDVRDVVEDYATNPYVSWANPIPIPHLEGENPIVGTATMPAATNTPTTIATRQPIKTREPLEKDSSQARRVPTMLIALCACGCLAAGITIACVTAIVIVYRRRHMATSANSARQR
jgi:hypothetical protein